MKINEDLQLPSLNKSILNAITDATEIDSIGNNSNGYYMKFKNGIMIQWGNQSKGTQTFTTDWWSFTNRSGNEEMSCTFPLEFKAILGCCITPYAHGAFPIINGSNWTTKASQHFGMGSPKGNTSSREVRCSFIAIGTWK